MENSTSMQGKVVLITGATAGIGLAAAHALAQKGAVILGVGRSSERCNHSAAEISSRYPASKVQFFTADLSSQQQVRNLALEVSDYLETSNEGRLDVLINNAGTVTAWYAATEDGYETQFAVNHLAPFLLTHKLLPLLRKSDQARVLTVSSRSHRNMRICWNDIMMRRFYNPLLAYKQSKLANVLFTTEFNRRYAENSGLRAYAIDPGLVNTRIGSKNNTGIVQWVWDWRRKQGADPKDAARTVSHVASEPHLSPPDGIYWKNCECVLHSRYAQRTAEAARLWELSLKLCGIFPDLPVTSY